MSQAEFLAWSEEASRKRNECVAERLPVAERLTVDEFRAWLEQRRVRRACGKSDRGWPCGMNKRDDETP